MKRNLLYFLGLFVASFANAQNTFTDDIESYQSDSYIGASSPNWRTWSTTGEGTNEDALVTNEVAHSGKQSIRLEAGSANQGPTDLVLPFGGEKNLGTFIYTMYVYVTADNSAYWNFQAKATIGTTWALDNYVTGDGRFRATLGTAANGNLCDVEFPHDAWVKYTMIANMTRNQWEILIDDKSVVKFSNPNNTLAYIDIFPLFDAAYASSASLYYIDDVSYEYQPYTLKNIDAGVLNLNVKSKFLAGEASGGTVQIRNLGKTAITSVDLTCSVDNGTPINISAPGINVASLGVKDIAIGPITYKKGNSIVNCQILKVNGNPDDDSTNNVKDLGIVGIQAAANKVMFTEEATGTWCQFCPRGAVYMDSMARTYPKHWAGVAVHNNDPMTVRTYDSWIATFPGFSGYPSIINDRNQLTDPLTVESDFYDHIVVPTPVILTNGAKYNAATKEIEVSVK